MERQHQGIDRPGVRQVPEGGREQRKVGEAGCEIISGAPTTVAVKGQMIMMMIVIETKSCAHKTNAYMQAVGIDADYF